MAMNTAKRKELVERMKANSEPVLNEENYTSSLLTVLNYYNYHANDKDKQKWLVTYVAKTDKRTAAKILKNASERQCRYPGIIARLLLNGSFVGQRELDRLEDAIKVLSADSVKPIEIKEVEVPQTNVISIQERMEENARKHGAEIDAAIDEFTITKTSNFSAKNYLLSNNVAGPIAKRIGEYFKPLSDELREAIAGDDEQLVEGYSNFTKRELKKFADFVDTIIADCNQQVQTAKANRAPRKRKEVSPTKLVSKMKYMKEFAELNLKSASPTSIIGSTEVWYYNTKYRHIGVYKAEGGNTLSVKGTTIIGFDIKESKRMTLRKPEEFFKGLSMGKRALNSALKALKTKAQQPNGRFNEECILLGAF